mgnify:FL=1
MLKVDAEQQMHAAVLSGKGEIKVQQTRRPEIGLGDVLLHTGAALICGTDVRITQHGHAAIPDGASRVLGHEFSGVVVAVGREVRDLDEGMRVAVAPNVGCGRCDECVSGNTHLCAEYRALGIHLDGGFAEFVLIPAAAVRQGNVIEIPAEMSYAEAALAEPLSCAFNGFERCAIRPGDTVLVMGAGPIGLMHAQLAELGGASAICISDMNAERLERCRRVNASWIPIPADEVNERIRDLTGGRGVDVCITACPAAAAQVQALELAAMNGRVLFFGGLPKDRSIVPLDTNLIHYKQLIVTGTTRASVAQFRKVLSLIAEGRLDVKGFITHTFDIAEIRAALACAAAGLGLRCMVTFNGQGH